MVCKGYGSEVRLIHIDENYVTNEMCEKCPDASQWKLGIDQIFDNLRVGCMDKQFQLMLRKGIYSYEYMDD